jgi:hypothetical protein
VTALARVDPLPDRAVTRPEDIAALPADQRAALITRALEESKSWLAVAAKGTDPTPIAEFKAWAATVAEMTRQKGLSEEIQLDALEMVRRAERGIGIAIRNGQEAGEISRTGQGGGPRGDYLRGGRVVRVAQEPAVETSRISVGSFGIPTDQLARCIYPVVDDVSDEDFGAALAEARVEGNLSNANVVRKTRQRVAQPEPPPPSPAPEPAPVVRLTRLQKAEKIRALAAAGYTSRQMAKPLATLDSTIRDIAREHGVDIPADRVTARLRNIDPVRVVRETVFALEGLRQGLGLLTPEDLDALPPDLIGEWLDSLPESLHALQKLTKELKNRVRP